MSNPFKFYGTAAGLLGKALGFRYARLRAAPLKPEVISLAVTNRCNSHCIMCNMWRRAKEHPNIQFLELSRREIIDLFSRPLFSGLVELDLTGGEPHLRDDLVEIALGIAGLKNNFLPHLRSIVITSNGLLPERIIPNYQKILEGLRDTHIDLVTVASLDGIGATHDKIRGTKGAFKLATGTIGGLLELREKYSGYFIGVKTTVLPENIDSLDDILEFAMKENLFHIISPVFFTETRFRNTDRREALRLSPADHEKLLNFYNRNELNTNYFYSRIRSFLSTGRKCWSCTASYNYMFIEADGTVYPCELLSEPIGNVKEQDPEVIWSSSQAHYWRTRIEKTEQCRNCIEPGAVRYSACAEGLSYLGFLRKLGGRQFNESLYGEGFIKYLDR
ncbi:MAG: radical SAM protein [Dehalococcoidales bacterium]|nr:radical SAM protein [Dehalococcoidales bacterium]